MTEEQVTYQPNKKAPAKRYSTEERKPILDDIANGMSVKKASEKYGVSVGSISNWRDAKSDQPSKEKTAPKQRSNTIEVSRDKILELILQDSGRVDKIITLFLDGKL